MRIMPRQIDIYNISSFNAINQSALALLEPLWLLWNKLSRNSIPRLSLSQNVNLQIDRL